MTEQSDPLGLGSEIQNAISKAMTDTPEMPPEMPNFSEMSDEELVAYLDELRAKNASKNTAIKRTPKDPATQKKPPEKKGYIDVDL